MGRVQSKVLHKSTNAQPEILYQQHTFQMLRQLHTALLPRHSRLHFHAQSVTELHTAAVHQAVAGAATHV